MTDKKPSSEISIKSFKYKQIEEHFITINPDNNSESLSGQLEDYIRKNNAQIISQFIFSGPELKGSLFSGNDTGQCPHNWPVTILKGDQQSDNRLYSTQVFAISGCASTPVFLNGKIAGFIYENEDAEYCFMGDIGPTDITLSRAEQTLNTFGNITKVLENVGMNFTNVVRTWLYLDKLLDWYSEFNTVRTSFFNEHGVFDNIVPASTGIGAGNLQGSALVTNVLAIKPKNTYTKILPVTSPLQCPALTYKSSFSRAAEVLYSDHRQLFISGTASIDINGKSMHKGDTGSQIERTMAVVNAIIESRSMNWKNIVRSIVYLKDINDGLIFKNYCKQHCPTQFPVSFAQTDICRSDLLFEIEVDLMTHDTCDC